jgi:superfamily II DNA/RNA helicase
VLSLIKAGRSGLDISALRVFVLDEADDFFKDE